MEISKSNGKTKICIIHTTSISLYWFMFEQVKALSNSGFDITIVANMSNEHTIIFEPYACVINISIQRGFNLFNSVSSIFKIMKILKAKRFDFVQYATPNAALYASISSKIYRIPIRLYNQWGIRYIGMRGIKKVIFKKIEQLVCKLSTNIEPDSFSNRDFAIREHLYYPKKSHIVWNGSSCGVNLKKFDFNFRMVWQNKIRHELGFNEFDFIFGFVGRVNKDKGILELISAFNSLSRLDAKLIIIGKMEMDISIISDYLDNDNILLLDNKNNIEEYMSALDCLVLPSHREGFGNVIIEAQAVGTAVLSSNIDGPKDVIEDGVNGLFFKVKDYLDLASKMKKILMDKKLREKLIFNGLVSVRNKYNQKELMIKIIEKRNDMIKNMKVN